MKILKIALKVKPIKGINLISLENPKTIEEMLKSNPYANYFSEWRYDLVGPLKYKYRPHNNGIGEQLYGLYKKGFKSSLPKLTAVYTRKELSDLLMRN